MARNLFNSIRLFKPRRNRFDLSHDVKMSLNMGKLYPTLVQECVPGDSFNLGCQSLVRMAPMVAPVMHRLNVYQHYFFVPNRILWDGWEKWITDASSSRVFPFISYNNDLSGPRKLSDYLGLPKYDSSIGVDVSALPFAAYQAIYHEYFRDQNLVPEFDYKLVDGNNTTNAELTKLRYRAWQHDYFTAALPFAQKGNAVDIPLGDVRLKDDWELHGQPHFQNENDVRGAGDVSQGPAGSSSTIQLNGTPEYAYNPDGTLETSPTSINDLRRAFKLQEWLEKNARAGTRYVESVLSHFGVKSPDMRLQRPEYITGAKSGILISEVLNTTGESGGLPQGNMAGHGVATMNGYTGNYYCQEHGYIIGIMSIMPVTAYQQGVPRHFLKTKDQFEYFWPSFAHIGEQEVKKSEIYISSSPSYNSTPFGYVPRYAEYKFNPSRVSGDFRNTLQYWHLGRIFSETPGEEPQLNQEFIECKPRYDIFAVTSEDVDHFYVHIYHQIKAVRPMPKFGTPTI